MVYVGFAVAAELVDAKPAKGTPAASSAADRSDHYRLI